MGVSFFMGALIKTRTVGPSQELSVQTFDAREIIAGINARGLFISPETTEPSRGSGVIVVDCGT